jgi:hypothetical protein
MVNLEKWGEGWVEEYKGGKGEGWDRGKGVGRGV